MKQIIKTTLLALILLTSCNKKVTPPVVTLTAIYPTPEVDFIEVGSNQVKTSEAINNLGYEVTLKYLRTQAGKDFYSLTVKSDLKKETLYIVYSEETKDIWNNQKYKIKIKKKKD